MRLRRAAQRNFSPGAPELCRSLSIDTAPLFCAVSRLRGRALSPLSEASVGNCQNGRGVTPRVEARPSGIPARSARAPDLMTVTEIANYLRVRERTIYELVRTQRIPSATATALWNLGCDQYPAGCRSVSSLEEPGVAAKRGECDVAPIHLLAPKNGEYASGMYWATICGVSGRTRRPTTRSPALRIVTRSPKSCGLVRRRGTRRSISDGGLKNATIRTRSSRD